MHISFLYDLVGIITGLGGIFIVFRTRSETKVRNAVAVERNTEATERLSDVVEKLADKFEAQDKRLDRVEYKIFGVDRAR